MSPPSLLDDVDAVQAQISRTMLQSGDWVTARLDGIAYLEKSPLKYWMIAVSFAIFGVRDWAARLPLALSVVALCWLTYRFGVWGFGRKAGFYAGLTLSTCIGLFLFTRVQIPDAALTLTIAMALFCLLRALEDDEPRPERWAWLMWASLGVGLLLKGLIAVLFPAGAGLLYIVFARRDWRDCHKKLRPVSGVALLLLIAAPWHILATLRNPPYFDLTLHSEAGSYRGFFWFYFINEHLLRFLNLRYPRDYNTVPRLYFWAFHLLWLFPWSAYLPAAVRGEFRPVDRAGRARLLALCWIGFVLVFFSFSTTQEYYSMPCYPALALLIGAGIARGGKLVLYGTRAVAIVSTLGLVAVGGILIAVRDIAAPGDIAAALTQNPDLYTLSLGHMTDLTLNSFAYLRLPLAVAALAFLVGASSAWMAGTNRAVIGIALMSVGNLRSLSGVAPAGRSSERRAARKAGDRRSVLCFFLGFLLHQSRRSAVEWPREQPGIRILRAGRARCLPRRRRFRAAVDRVRTLLPGGCRTGPAAVREAGWEGSATGYFAERRKVFVPQHGPRHYWRGSVGSQPPWGLAFRYNRD